MDEFGATLKSELAATDPGVVVTASPVDLPPKVMEAAAQGALIGAVYAVPQGVYRMSADVPGLVETSGNLGVLTITGARPCYPSPVTNRTTRRTTSLARRMRECPSPWVSTRIPAGSAAAAARTSAISTSASSRS